jgi:hypothetical protein
MHFRNQSLHCNQDLHRVTGQEVPLWGFSHLSQQLPSLPHRLHPLLGPRLREVHLWQALPVQFGLLLHSLRRVCHPWEHLDKLILKGVASSVPLVVL